MDGNIAMAHEQVNENEHDSEPQDDDAITRWCELCQMNTTISTSTPYGTCMCS